MFEIKKIYDKLLIKTVKSICLCYYDHLLQVMVNDSCYIEILIQCNQVYLDSIHFRKFINHLDLSISQSFYHSVAFQQVLLSLD